MAFARWWHSARRDARSGGAARRSAAAWRLRAACQRALEFDVNQAFKGRIVGVGERHDAGVVDQHVDTAERRLRDIELPA